MPLGSPFDVDPKSSGLDRPAPRRLQVNGYDPRTTVVPSTRYPLAQFGIKEEEAVVKLEGWQVEPAAAGHLQGVADRVPVLGAVFEDGEKKGVEVTLEDFRLHV